MTETDKKSHACPASACKKMAVIAAVVLGLIIGLSYMVDSQTLDEIKYNFSLWSIIALVVIINLVSGLCFLFAYMAYRWVNKDLKSGPFKEEDTEE